MLHRHRDVMLCLGIVLVASAVVWAEDSLPWWKTATVYRVYPRSFKDSDGDGVGDLKGIMQKSEYFKEIGVDAVCLAPFFRSPMVDFGYDISDFRDIDPIFGTMVDFKQLIEKLKSLDIKLLLDIVPNHSSDQHPWFNKSLHRVDPYTDYYVWHDGRVDPDTRQRVPPNNWLARFNGSAWEWREERQQYFLHLFTSQQIDFNFRNPAVIKEFDDILTHWLDLGVDGFRMDSVVFLTEGDYGTNEVQLLGTTGQRWEDYDHSQTLNQQESFDLLAHWEQLVYNYSQRDGKQRAFFMEAYTDDENTLKLYGHGNTSFAIPYNLKLQQQASQSTQAPELRGLIQSYLTRLTLDATPTWVIGNHDNQRLADRYGPEAADALGMLQGVLPGVKVVYYGEEIGMRDTYVRWDQTVDPGARVLGPDHYMERNRDPVRTPMQWDDSTSAGFSTSNKTWLPININYLWLNVEAQKNAKTSHLKVFKDVANIRKDPVLQRGKTIVVATNNNTLSVVRYFNGIFYTYIYNMGTVSAVYTTENFFSGLGLDLAMSVEIASANSKISKGTLLPRGTASLSLRPKAAVILRSPSSTSSATNHLAIQVLLIFALIINLLR